MLAVNESKRKVRTRFGKQLYAIYIYNKRKKRKHNIIQVTFSLSGIDSNKF